MGARRAIHTLFTSLLMLAAAGCSSPTGQDGEWVPCVIHCHSTYSDGLENVGKLAAEARAAGARVLVVTDHFEDIWLPSFRNLLLRGRIGPGLMKASGWKSYVDACQKASNAQLTVVPGVEVGVGNPWDPYRARDTQAEGKTRKVHLLGIGLLTEEQALGLASSLGIRRDGRDYEGETRDLADGQAEAAWAMWAEGLGVVIAHPWLPTSPFEPDDLYTYYRNKAARIHGVEFFSGEDRESLRALGLEEPDPNASKQPSAYGVTAGSDFHGWLPSEVGKLRDRITWVRVPTSALSGSWERQCEAIAEGVRSGCTVAGVGALQRGDTLQTWLERVRPRDAVSQPQYRPFEYLPGRLIWKREHPEAGTETTSPQDQTEPRDALIAFTRSGNVFVRDLGTGEERQLTHDGVTHGPDGWTYGAPTFLDATTVLAARWEVRGSGREVEWARQIVALSLDGEVTRTDAGPPGSVGFGLSRHGEALYYLAIVGNDTSFDGAALELVRRDSRGREDRLSPRSCFENVGTDKCRLRLSDDGTHVSIPRFASDVSSFYSLWSIATGEQVNPAWFDEEGWRIATGFDFGDESVYVGLWDADRPGGPTQSMSGLWRMTPEFRLDKLIASCDTRGGIAVSEELGVAAAATSGLGDPDACELNLVNLSSGAVSLLCRGGDPDLWPRGGALRQHEVEADLDAGELAEYTRRLRVGDLDEYSSVAGEKEAVGYFWMHYQSPQASTALVELARDRRTVMRAQALRVLAARYGSSPGVPQALAQVAGDSTDGDMQRLARLCAQQLSAPDGRTWVIEDGEECVSEAGTLAEMPFGTEVELLGLEPPPGHDNSESPHWVWAKVRAVGDGRIWYLRDCALLNRPPHEWWGHAEGVTCPYCD